MRTSKKPELLLEYLAKEKRRPFSLKELAEKLVLKRKQTYTILFSLQEKGMICIKKSIRDKRRKYITLQEDTTMARLRKREMTSPLVSEMAASLKKNMFRKNKKPRVPLQPITIPFSIMKILEHWNSFECVPKLGIPEPVNGFYHNPTKRLKETVSALRKLITGNLFSSSSVVELRQLNQPFTVNEITETIKNYCRAAFSSDYLPYNKEHLIKKPLIEIIHNNHAGYLKDKSLFMHFFHNPPQLTPAIEAQRKRSSTEKDQEQKTVKREKDSLLFLEEGLFKYYDEIFGIENDLEKADLKKVAIVLYDFAEQHGGVDSQQWAWYAIDALRWRKENTTKRFHAVPKTMLQDWFYTGVMLDYFHFKNMKGFIYVPELYGEPPEQNILPHVIGHEESLLLDKKQEKENYIGKHGFEEFAEFEEEWEKQWNTYIKSALKPSDKKYHWADCED